MYTVTVQVQPIQEVMSRLKEGWIYSKGGLATLSIDLTVMLLMHVPDSLTSLSFLPFFALGRVPLHPRVKKEPAISLHTEQGTLC